MRAVWIDGFHALLSITVELPDSTAEVGMLGSKLFEKAIHLAIGSDVVLFQSKG